MLVRDDFNTLTPKEMNKTAEEQARLVAVQYVFEQIIDSEIVDWACDMLRQGIDSEHLRLLAGYHLREIERNRDAFLSDLKETLKELGIVLPDKPKAFTELACFICKQYLGGSICYKDALSRLYNIWIETNYNPENKIDNRFDIWMYFDDSIDLVEEGYGPLLKQLHGLRADNQEFYFRQEVERFLRAYGPE